MPGSPRSVPAARRPVVLIGRKRPGFEPDAFFYDKAAKLIAEQPANTPLFTFVYLAANHFPWEKKFRPELLPSWRSPGNAPVVDEYLRRQAISASDYAGFIATLKKKFPAQPFLIVRYGDHQPEFSSEPAGSRPR